MKHLKKYKIFENKEDKDLDYYLSKMDTSKEDIEDIFIDFIDTNDFWIDYSLFFKDKKTGDSFSSYKKLRSYYPIVQISLNGKQKLDFDDLKYISNLYFSLQRFFSMFSDKLKKINWRIYSGSGVYIDCIFKEEVNEDIPDISIPEISDLLIEFINKNRDSILNKDFWSYELLGPYGSNYKINLYKMNYTLWLRDQESKILADKNYAKSFGDYMINNEDDSMEIINRTMDFFEEFLIKEKKLDVEILAHKKRIREFKIIINGVPMFDFYFDTNYQEKTFTIGKFFKKEYDFAFVSNIRLEIRSFKD